MRFFRKKDKPSCTEGCPEIYSAQRYSDGKFSLPASVEPFEKDLYDKLRFHIPIIDAAITKIIRLTGGFEVICSDESLQNELNSFLENVPVGLTGKSISTFIDNFLDSLITFGSAVGEIVIDGSENRIAGLYNGDPSAIKISAGASPLSRQYSVRSDNGKFRNIAHPERILYSSLPNGRSVLRGLPAISSILLRIYQCIGQNFDRAGNVRYAVTYKPQKDSGDAVYSKERALQIAREWQDGMNSAKYGSVKDFVAVGDVDIKVIGADNQLFDTNVPVRQLLEQIVSKLSIPPFLLGLSWSSTERMSSQQADILTSELEYYRRILTPVITDIADAYLCSKGYDAQCRVEWVNINLQDESALAEARLKNAQAREIEMRLENSINS